MRAAHLFLTAAVMVSVLGSCGRPRAAPGDTSVAGSATATAAPPATVPAPAAPASVPPAGGTIRVAAAPQGPQPLKMPMVFPQTCEGEDCGVDFPAFACAAVELRSAAADTAPVVARVAKGDTVNVRTVDLHVLEPGLVILRRDFALDWVDNGEERHPASDTLRFAAGDTVYLLRYEELGNWTWWHRGLVQSGTEFWAGPVHESLGGVTRNRDSSVAVALSHPRRASWWRVELPSGASGWWRADGSYSLLSIPWMRHWETGCPPWK